MRQLLSFCLWPYTFEPSAMNCIEDASHPLSTAASHALSAPIYYLTFLKPN
jgi:hypothetical protein